MIKLMLAVNYIMGLMEQLLCTWRIVGPYNLYANGESPHPTFIHQCNFIHPLQKSPQAVPINNTYKVSIK